MFTRILLLEERFTTCHIIMSVKYFVSDVEKISNTCKIFVHSHFGIDTHYFLFQRCSPPSLNLAQVAYNASNAALDAKHLDTYFMSIFNARRSAGFKLCTFNYSIFSYKSPWRLFIF